MKRVSRLTGAVVAFLFLFGAAASAFSLKESIEVYRNLFTLKVNGTEVTVDNFVLDDVPYVSLVDTAELLGMEVAWDAKSRTASVRSKSGLTKLKLPEKVDPFHPVIDLKSLGLTAGLIDAIGLESDQGYVSKQFAFAGEQLLIKDAAANTGSVLEMNSQYRLKLYARNNAAYQVEFTTTGLAEIRPTGQRQVIYVPAMPEKGFHWPYYLVIPSDQYKAKNQDHKRYLVVDTNNTGVSNDVAEMTRRTGEEVEQRRQVSMSLAEELWSPMLMPAFPRPEIVYDVHGEINMPYTHALDRSSATLHLQMKDPAVKPQLEAAFDRAGFDPVTLLNLDRQLAAMIDHATGYLNQYGQKVESKVFLVGYSASGTFTDRFATLHPEKVKALASGATLDDMILPMAEYKGERLIFPIGTSDYKEITGRSFDLAAHNQVARLIYMGEDDTNNTVPAMDCYGDTERRIITKLWGVEVLPRAKQLTTLYGQAGGKGIFILDRGVKHGASAEMNAYVKQFLEANRDSTTPIYPIPSNPAQLKYTLYK